MADIYSYINDINASMAVETTMIVKLWMLWMGLLFCASVVFIRRRPPARAVFLAMLATLAAILYIWHLTKNVHLFGVAHILIWFPLMVYLWASILTKQGREKYRPFKYFYIWICLLVATIVISLVFDVRDIYLVMMDLK